MQTKEMGSTEKLCCRKCGAGLEKDIRALNKKYFGAAVNEFYCMQCLAEIFGVTTDELYRQIEYFKSIGCAFFK